MELFLVCVVLVCLVLTGYHFVGYPLTLWLLAAVRPRAVVRRPIRPSVSLITAAHNEAGIIAEKIENSLALAYPELEIIVVSDGSTDGTAEIARRYASRGVIVHELAERRGKAHALNAGAMLASGEILLVSDANAFPYPDAVDRLVRPFADPEVGLVSGSVTAHPPENALGSVARSEALYWRYEDLVKRLETAVGSTMGVVGSLLAIRHRVFRPIPENVINDDGHLLLSTLRSGYRVVHEPSARCWRRASRSTADDYLRRRRIAAGRFQHLLRAGSWPWNKPLAVFQLASHKLLRLALPFLLLAFVAADLAMVMLPGSHWGYTLLLGAPAGFLALGLIGRFAERTRRRWLLPRLAYYLLGGYVGLASGLVSHTLGSQGVRWQKAAR